MTLLECFGQASSEKIYKILKYLSVQPYNIFNNVTLTFTFSKETLMIQKITFLFVLYSSLLQVTLHAQEWRCQVEKVNIEEKSGERTFLDANLEKDKVGKSVKLSNYEFFLWKTPGELHAVINKDQKQLIKNTLDLKSSHFNIIAPPDFEATCKLKALWPQSDEKIFKITESADLTKLLKEHASQLIVTVFKQLTFLYKSEAANDRMRTIFFQNGEEVTLYAIHKEKPWCSMTVQIKLDENTYLLPKIYLEPTSIETFTNNEKSSVLSLSFFDFERGESNYRSSRFAPFNIECSLPKGSALTMKDFNQITGNAILISPKQN